MGIMFHWWSTTKFCRPLQRVGLLAAFVILSLASCGPSDPVLKYSLNTPPLVLAPTSLAQVSDGRGRFREIFCAIQRDHGTQFPHNPPCEEVLHRLSNESDPVGNPIHLGQASLNLRILIVPGTMAECVKDIFIPLPYARAHLEEHGYKTGVIPVSGRMGSTHNAKEIRDFLVNLDAPRSEKVVLLGYSKGLADVLEAVVEYPGVQERVAAVVSFAGIVNGSPLADDLSGFAQAIFDHLHIPSCPDTDGEGIPSLSRDVRLSWLAKHDLPSSIQYFSLVAFTERENISAMIRGAYDQLATIDPRNDSQVIFSDAVIPGGTLLGYVNADHWAIALPVTRDMPTVAKTLINRNAFPREVLLEAIIRFIEERLQESHTFFPQSSSRIS